MKKYFIALLSVLIFSFYVSAQSGRTVVFLTEQNIEQKLNGLKTGISYSIHIPDSFNTDLLIEKLFSKKLANKLSEIFWTSEDNTLTGPVSYIYYKNFASFGGGYSLEDMVAVVKQQKDKIVILDVSDGLYSIEEIFNAIKDCPNLYRINGPVASEGFPDEAYTLMKETCPNLRTVYMRFFRTEELENAQKTRVEYEQQKLLQQSLKTEEIVLESDEVVEETEAVIQESDDAALKAEELIEETAESNKEAVETEENPESEIENNEEVIKTDSEAESKEDSDEISEETQKVEEVIATEKKVKDEEEVEEEIYPPSKPCDTGVVWLIDRWGRFQRQKLQKKTNYFGYYDYINSESYIPPEKPKDVVLPLPDALYESYLKGLDFESIGNYLLITKRNAASFDVLDLQVTDPLEVAKAFIASYFLKTATYKTLIVDADDKEAKLEVSLSDGFEYNIRDFSNLKIYLFNEFDPSTGDGPLMIGLEGEINGETVKEVTVLRMKKNGKKWGVVNIFNGWIDYYINLAKQN